MFVSKTLRSLIISVSNKVLLPGLPTPGIPSVEYFVISADNESRLVFLAISKIVFLTFKLLANTRNSAPSTPIDFALFSRPLIVSTLIEPPLVKILFCSFKSDFKMTACFFTIDFSLVISVRKLRTKALVPITPKLSGGFFSKVSKKDSLPSKVPIF